MNPAFAVEIAVVALGGGSFRPQIKAKAKRLAGLLLGDFRQGIVGALAALIVARGMGFFDAEHEDYVIIVSAEGDKIILPSDAYDGFRRAREHSDVDRNLRHIFEILEEDEDVRSFGFARRSDEPREKMPFQIDRERFADIARPRVPAASNQRIRTVSDAPLQVLRAIFEDSARRWQFVWRGNRISAPLLDKVFRKRIVRKEVAIVHGDVFVVELRIYQTADDSGIWINDSYEVVTIQFHQRAAEQPNLLEP